MIKKTRFLMVAIVILSLIASSTAFGRSSVETLDKKQLNNLSAGAPAYQIVAHRVGRISMALNNNGTFGTGFSVGNGFDAITGQTVPSCEYPKSSGIEYLFAGAFWIGAVVGRDTLVSTAADGWNSIEEFLPDQLPFGAIKKRSILYPEIDSLYEGAISEEDYIMVYRDTGTLGIDNDVISGRPHTPLNIEITQRSFAWSYPYADDFILFDYEIKNIGLKKLEKVYMGIYVDGDVGSPSGPDGTNYHTDDVSGFIETFPDTFLGHEFLDTVNIAWLADNDGDPLAGVFDRNSATAVTGTRIMRIPSVDLEVSYNWWISGGSPSTDFGPRERSYVGKLKEPFRDLGTGALGTPEGDANKYYFMRNREFDYDQHRIKTIGSNDTLWLQPDPTLADAWAVGLDTRYLLSFGPFNIDPGERLPLSFAYVAGDSFHVITDNIQNLPDNPDVYYANLNFAPLAENASWASKVYDNPGVDTDGDGYFGEFIHFPSDSEMVIDTTSSPGGVLDDTTWVITKEDTLYTSGDGVPDFKGASPPPAPKFWLTPDVGSIHIRFNGLRSETTKDVFSRTIDFEGYRVYYARDEKESSYSMLASFDILDYNQYLWDEKVGGFKLLGVPLTLDSLICLYGQCCNDSCSTDDFNPSEWTRSNPFTAGDKIIYFEPQDFNASIFGVNTPIRKIYPDQPYPTSLIPDSAQADELTSDGYLKYFEYETTIDNLLSTVPYHFNVTAFDFGSPESGLASLETSKSLNAQIAYANTRADRNLAENNKVYIYPNPYRIDGNYQDEGFERKPPDQLSAAPDRIRAIHFANLPPKCTIKIFSLDGDLIRQIEHDADPLDPTSGHDSWNLITRNTQLTVSGLYYWTVESEGNETQIGKLVIIM